MKLSCNELEIAFDSLMKVLPRDYRNTVIKLDDVQDILSEQQDPEKVKEIIDNVIKFRIWQADIKEVEVRKLVVSWRAAINDCKRRSNGQTLN